MELSPIFAVLERLTADHIAQIERVVSDVRSFQPLTDTWCRNHNAEIELVALSFERGAAALRARKLPTVVGGNPTLLELHASHVQHNPR